MEKLIKPSEYAKRAGISRQAVYAKIKKGILSSRNVNGKIYIVDDDMDSGKDGAASGRQKASPEISEVASSSGRSMRELLLAKEETISVLKETIKDMKETNHMITSTLRSEVELLKEAFGEMKTLYAAQIEHMKRSEDAEIGDEEDADEIVPVEDEPEQPPAKDPGKKSESRWISMPAWLYRHGIEKKKYVKEARKRAKKLLKEKDPRIKKENGEYYLKTQKGLEKELLKNGGK